jgi:hypothetical protein
MAATARNPCSRKAPAAFRRMSGSESSNFSISFKISKSGCLRIIVHAVDRPLSAGYSVLIGRIPQPTSAWFARLDKWEE